MKRFYVVFIALFIFIFCSSIFVGCAPKDGVDGIDGKDGVNGIDGIDGKDGKDGTKITIGANGNWYLDGIDSGVSALENKNDARFVYDHVIIFGVDGGGAWFDDADMPNLDAIFKNGATTDKSVCANPSMSAPNWSSILTGVNTNLNEIRTNWKAYITKYENEEYPTVFGLLNQVDNNAQMASYASWPAINLGIVEDNLGIDKKTFYSEEEVSALEYDSQNVAEIINRIEELPPRLMFVQLDHADVAGHSYGFGSERHISALHDIDNFIGDVFTAIKQKGIVDKTLFMVVTDHGGYQTNHGGKEQSAYNTFFGAVGKSIVNNHNLNMYSRDIAAITCWALGIDGNEKWQAEIPQNLFKDNITPKRKRIEYGELQQMWLTPKPNTVSHLFNYVDSEKLKAGLFFDDNVSDVVGMHVATATDAITYEKGFYGKAVRTSDQGAYVYYSDLKELPENFSIALWFKADENNLDEACLLSNKDWSNGTNEGLNLSWYLNGNYADSPKRTVWYNHANGEERYDYNEFLPDINTYDDWMHLLISVNRTQRAITGYLNFNLIGTFDMSSTPLTINGQHTFSIGSDGLGNCGFNGLIDDFLLFNDSLSYYEVVNLKNYYAQ